MPRNYDFCGWATKANILCSDGRTIMPDAFAHNDGAKVPLVWNHQHNKPEEVLGYAILENRGDGVYAYGTFNDTESGRTAKLLVQHGDVDSLSIYANQLKESMHKVTHGNIREVSLVLAGANIGAHIEKVVCHGDEEIIDEGEIYSGEKLSLYHADGGNDSGDNEEEPDTKDKKKSDDSKKEKKEMADKEKTIGDVIDTLDDEQKEAVYALIGMALEEAGVDGEGDDEEMKHNIFEMDEMEPQAVLSHSDLMEIVADGKKFGSLRESFLAHAEELGIDDIEYGIEDIDYLFPEAKLQNMPPEFIKRKDDWVSVVMNGVHHTPFSRIKSMFADITEDEARAKGYIKGKLKKEEVFSLLKRTTSPTTVYKKQKMDREDVIDITDFDVIVWLKGEMRMMLDEELALAFLLGDGRLASDDDHIDQTRIRPIVNDADLFVIRWGVSGADEEEFAKNFIKAAIKSRKNYRGSGNPVMFTSEDTLTDMLLLEDGIGHKLYKTEQEVATACRVSRIVTMPQLDNWTDKDGKKVYAIIVNLNDYNAGADKGGAVTMFEDFDIDYNQQKYLIETRCSGAMVKPFSAIVLREDDTTESNEPTWKQAMDEFR